MVGAYISIAHDFSATPGGRFIKDGDRSGEEFRVSMLEPQLVRVIDNNEKLRVDLDGTAGYATSFLEEAFGGLVRDLRRHVSPYIVILTDNQFRKREVEKYISDAEARL